MTETKEQLLEAKAFLDNAIHSFRNDKLWKQYNLTDKDLERLLNLRTEVNHKLND